VDLQAATTETDLKRLSESTFRAPASSPPAFRKGFAMTMSPTPRRDAAERRLAEGGEGIRRDNARIASAVRAFDRLLKLIEANPVSDPWQGNAGLALEPAQDAGREAFGYPPMEFVRDDDSDEFRRRRELIPNAEGEWLLQLNYPDAEPKAFRLGWHGELTLPPNSSPREFLLGKFAQLQPNIVGCLKQWLIEFNEWRSMNGPPNEVAESPKLEPPVELPTGKGVSAGLALNASRTSKSEQPKGTEPHPDGPEDPHWLWLNNERHKIGNGRAKQCYDLLKYFWSRESETFQGLLGNGKPWIDPVGDNAFSVAATRFNNNMPKGFPWKLKVDGRCMFKELS